MRKMKGKQKKINGPCLVWRGKWKENNKKDFNKPPNFLSTFFPTFCTFPLVFLSSYPTNQIDERIFFLISPSFSFLSPCSKPSLMWHQVLCIYSPLFSMIAPHVILIFFYNPCATLFLFSQLICFFNIVEWEFGSCIGVLDCVEICVMWGSKSCERFFFLVDFDVYSFIKKKKLS